jgi:hypothetical protein
MAGKFLTLSHANKSAVLRHIATLPSGVDTNLIDSWVINTVAVLNTLSVSL